MSEAMAIRLRCLSKECGREFDRSDSIAEDVETFVREKRCPFCESSATTLAHAQPLPPLWWSDSCGLLMQLPRKSVGEEIRYKLVSDEMMHRLFVSLPLDAVPLAPKPETDEHRERRQRAADRVAAYLDRLEKADAVDRPVNATGPVVVDSSLGRVRLLVDDLRLLIEAAPVLPPKWSGLLADPIVHVVTDENAVVLLATRDEERAYHTARESGASVTSVAMDK